MVKELAFSKVEEDAEGILQLSRSVLVDDDMGWHVQVRLLSIYGGSFQTDRFEFPLCTISIITIFRSIIIIVDLDQKKQ